MARIRSIRPEIWESEKLGRLSLLARFTFIGLISLADDEGRGRANTAFVNGRLHMYSTEIGTAETEKAMKELAGARLINLYDVDGFPYYELPGWKVHQKIDRPQPSLLPGFDGQAFGHGRGRTPQEEKAAVPTVRTNPTHQILDTFIELRPELKAEGKKLSVFYSRYGRSAKELLAVCGGDPAKAIEQLRRSMAHWAAKGMTPGLDAAVKDALDPSRLVEKPKPGEKGSPEWYQKAEAAENNGDD